MMLDVTGSRVEKWSYYFVSFPRLSVNPSNMFRDGVTQLTHLFYLLVLNSVNLHSSLNIWLMIKKRKNRKMKWKNEQENQEKLDTHTHTLITQIHMHTHTHIYIDLYKCSLYICILYREKQVSIDCQIKWQILQSIRALLVYVFSFYKKIIYLF